MSGSSTGEGHSTGGLPSLTTREDVQCYITRLAEELGVSLNDSRLAEELDKRDQLAKFRSQFHIPTVGELTGKAGGTYQIQSMYKLLTLVCLPETHHEDPEDSKDCLYFTGNSLGLQPRGAGELVQGEMEKWARRGSEGHFTGKYPWLPVEDFLTEESARIVGGKSIEVAVMNGLTTNVHLSMVSHSDSHHIHSCSVNSAKWPSLISTFATDP